MRNRAWNRSASWIAACFLAVAALAPALSACGGSSPAATAKAPQSAATRHDPKPPKTVRGATCTSQLGGFLATMDELRTNLAAGVSYEQYVGEIKAARGAYHRVPVGRLALACLRAAGTPGESALNKYIDASNAWTECVETPGCESASVEPALQIKWRQASKFLSQAQQGLRGLEKPPKTS